MGHAASPQRAGSASGVIQSAPSSSVPVVVGCQDKQLSGKAWALLLLAVPCEGSYSTPGPVAVGFEVVRESKAAFVTRLPIPRQAGRWLARLQCPPVGAVSEQSTATPSLLAPDSYQVPIWPLLDA